MFYEINGWVDPLLLPGDAVYYKVRSTDDQPQTIHQHPRHNNEFLNLHASV